jgi:hypothetical protein
MPEHEYEPHDVPSYDGMDLHIEEQIREALACLERRHPLTAKDILINLLKTVGGSDHGQNTKTTPETGN